MIRPTGFPDPLGAPREGVISKEGRFEKAARKFEEMVIGILVKEMWKSVPKEGMVRQSTGMDVAQEMFQRELARDMSRAGGLGLAQDILDQARQTGLVDPGSAIPELPNLKQEGDLPGFRGTIEIQA